MHCLALRNVTLKVTATHWHCLVDFQIFVETETNNLFYCWTSAPTSPLRRYEKVLIWEFDWSSAIMLSPSTLNTAVSIRAIRIKAFQPVSEGGGRADQGNNEDIIDLLSFHCCLKVIWTLEILQSALSKYKPTLNYLNCILTSSIFSKLLTNRLTQTMVGPSMLSVLFWASPWGNSVSNECFYCKWVTDLWIISVDHLLQSTSISSLQLI